MNEKELKNLWQAEQTAPKIDFAAVETVAEKIQNKLRRKVKIEIQVQIAATIATIIPVFFRPKLIFLSLFTIALCIWYVPELRKLYQTESAESATLSIKDLLVLKLRTMKNFFRRTRIVNFIAVPLLLPFAYYGLVNLDNAKIVSPGFIRSFIFMMIVCETGVIIATEIYFKILYKPAYHKLKNLLAQLESGE